MDIKTWSLLDIKMSGHRH